MDARNYRLVVTSGPTREWIDPVRFISNPASGRTGWNVARCGVTRFREVIFISGPVATPFDAVEGATNINVETTVEMLSAVRQSIAPNSLLVMAAAPADFTPVQTANSKIKKQDRERLQLELKPAPDILLGIAHFEYENFYRVGFAAETDRLLENAGGKLKRKRLDYICANQVFKSQQGFGANENTLHVLDRQEGQFQLGPASKEDLGTLLLEFLIANIP